MSRLFQAATVAAVGITALTAIFMNVPGSARTHAAVPAALTSAATAALPGVASAQTPSLDPAVLVTEGTTPAVSQPDARDSSDSDDSVDADATPRRAASLSAAVESASSSDGAADDEQLRCLAAGVYFESNGEPLEGQLAVAHVILNRAASGRFADTPCGVLTQRGQFSFVRGGDVPTPPAGRSWRTAQAVARVAMTGSWQNPAPGAMYFHATRAAPGWNRTRVAQLGHHIFYR